MRNLGRSDQISIDCLHPSKQVGGMLISSRRGTDERSPVAAVSRVWNCFFFSVRFVICKYFVA